ncbi:MAG: glycogen/starch synthase, partial [Bacteroidales bacterium]|nr:glycogen/starch synthase [Bacteroidales bacterium]
MRKNRIEADYIFETSWEICNMVGGIHTVISTKALNLVKEYGDKLLLIGPDVWKETRNNPEFLEDISLFKVWKEKANEDGLRIRTGRWNIAGKPVVILVDFTPYFSRKDKIFAELWEKYKLDSLSGGWDYIEPALFGYAAAQVIESFYNFFLSAQDKIIAQFHEWMTGTGILYLKEKVPQAGCVFTTHATVLGRSIAGNNLPLYSNLNSYKPELLARQFGVLSKYSLESLSAKEADGFTTVSEITAGECKFLLGKDVDIVTPNGFEDSFVPQQDEFAIKRKNARKKLLSVARAVLNQTIPEDSILIINSGRYEFKNKGIDLFIDSLGQLQKNYKSKKNVIAFIAVP